MANIINNECLTLIIGEKGAGKSTLLANIALKCQKKGIPVYCNYPIKGCFKLPTVKNKFGYEVLDKEALYTGNWTNSVILIDEGANIWNARSHKNFTEVDSHWFNMLRHIHCQVFVVTQYIDMIDLNIKRNATEVVYCKRSFLPGFQRNERYSYSVKIVKDKGKECFDKRYDTVEFENCLAFSNCFRFRRKPYFNMFHSFYIDCELKDYSCPEWDKLVNFS